MINKRIIKYIGGDCPNTYYVSLLIFIFVFPICLGTAAINAAATLTSGTSGIARRSNTSASGYLIPSSPHFLQQDSRI